MRKLDRYSIAIGVSYFGTIVAMVSAYLLPFPVSPNSLDEPDVARTCVLVGLASGFLALWMTRVRNVFFLETNKLQLSRAFKVLNLLIFVPIMELSVLAIFGSSFCIGVLSISDCFESFQISTYPINLPLVIIETLVGTAFLFMFLRTKKESMSNFPAFRGNFGIIVILTIYCLIPFPPYRYRYFFVACYLATLQEFLRAQIRPSKMLLKA